MTPGKKPSRDRRDNYRRYEGETVFLKIRGDEGDVTYLGDVSKGGIDSDSIHFSLLGRYEWSFRGINRALAVGNTLQSGETLRDVTVRKADISRIYPMCNVELNGRQVREVFKV